MLFRRRSVDNGCTRTKRPRDKRSLGNHGIRTEVRAGGGEERARDEIFLRNLSYALDEKVNEERRRGKFRSSFLYFPTYYLLYSGGVYCVVLFKIVVEGNKFYTKICRTRLGSNFEPKYNRGRRSAFSNFKVSFDAF